MTTARAFLFLQGCTSPFFARLSDLLTASGQSVFRVNFNVGDACYWGGRPAWNFRQDVRSLPEFLEKIVGKHDITDVIMLGDTRAVHVPVRALAEAHDLRLHIVEEGYFRPNWVTFEEDGINGYSALPRSAEWYLRVADLLPKYTDGIGVSNPIALLAVHELGYHLPNILNPLLFPGYRTHRPYISGIEFYGWMKRFSQLPWHERKDQKAINHLIEQKKRFFLLPLQLDSDSQIQEHSPFKGISQVIETVMRSFAANAEKNDCMVVKNHPLDTGLIRYDRIVKRLTEELNLASRVYYLETGHLPTLLQHCIGLVTANSSVGTSALCNRVPTVALGRALYNIPGLTYQGHLSRFWNEKRKPDMRLFRAFRNAVIHTTQVNGGLYSAKGMDLAAENCRTRLALPEAPLKTLFEKVPP